MANSFYDDSLWTRIGNFLYNNRTWILGILVFIFFICTISLAARNTNPPCPETTVTPPSLPNSNCTIPAVGLRDCFPDNLPGVEVTKDACHERRCCWDETSEKCSMAANHPGYNISLIESNSNGLKARLRRVIPSGFKNDIEEVSLVITFLKDDLVRIKLTDPNNKRWEVILPEELEIPKAEISNLLYSVSLEEEGSLKVIRKSSGKVLLETNLSTLIYSDLFHQMEFVTASDTAFGFSEHKENEFVKKFNETRNYPIWNRGEQPSQGIRNLYGTHPFYLMPEDPGNKVSDSHGVFLLNSNAMDIVVHDTPSITWRVLGGVLDFFVFLGPTPLEATQQYISLIGKPSLPPYWSLGFHIARYGYNSSDKLKEVIKRNRVAQIPYDVQWTDIDALAVYHNIFTWDNDSFPDLPGIIEDLHEHKMKYIPMADPSISDTDPNGKEQYDAGKEFDIYVKREDNVTDLQIKVWNSKTSVWVDFTNPNATDFWYSLAFKLDSETPIDGFWIDMNEPYNMWDQTTTGCKDDIAPQYVPSIENGLLSNRTACLNAKHYLSDHYNVHNLYALYEAKSTYEALKRMGKRPFVLSRATSFSSGRYTAHWNGDIDSSWDHLRWSITSLLEFNMYGIPMIGADICGFQKYNVTEQLCARWMELGAFYPFSRNHNDFRIAIPNTDTWISPKRDNDPGSWEKEGDKESPVVVGSRNALNLKYQLMPYLYTVLAENSRTGVPAIRSLWFNNPTDHDTFNINDQFMWGDSLMVVPIVEETDSKGDTSKTSREVYLPEGHWWDIQGFLPGGKRLLQGSTKRTVEIPLDRILVLLKDGSVIASQEPKLTTTDTREGNFTLNIILDEHKGAKGSLYWDSGDSIDTIANNAFSLIDFSAKAESSSRYVLTATKQPKTKFDGKIILGKLVIVNIESKFGIITVNGELIPKLNNYEVTFDVKNKQLTFDFTVKWDINDLTNVKPLTIEWSKV